PSDFHRITGRCQTLGKITELVRAQLPVTGEIERVSNHFCLLVSRKSVHFLDHFGRCHDSYPTSNALDFKLRKELHIYRNLYPANPPSSSVRSGTIFNDCERRHPPVAQLGCFPSRQQGTREGSSIALSKKIFFHRIFAPISLAPSVAV